MYDSINQPPRLSDKTRYRFRHWWAYAMDYPSWLWVRWGAWRELGWRWFRPGHIFEWGGAIPQVWRYIKDSFWHRHNVIVVRTEPPTWQDRSEFLLPVMMQVLTDFVEKERPFDHFDTSHNYDQWWRIRDLYEWWHIRRPARLKMTAAALTAWHDEFERIGGITFGEVSGNTRRLLFPCDRGVNTAAVDRLSAARQALEAAGEAEDEAMMIRLVRLRGHLWT